MLSAAAGHGNSWMMKIRAVAISHELSLVYKHISFLL
jgi:hypothetical protein